MLTEEEKQFWIKKFAEFDGDEEDFIDEVEALPPEKNEEVSELLFQIFRSEPPDKQRP